MEPKSVCIDTDIIIDFTKDREPGATCYEFVQTNYPCSVTAISVYELWFGVKHTGHKTDLQILKELLNSFTIFPFDDDAAEVSASLDVKLCKKGQKLSIKDIFIAGICIANEVPLLTRNVSHFSRIPNLKLFPIEETTRYP